MKIHNDKRTVLIVLTALVIGAAGFVSYAHYHSESAKTATPHQKVRNTVDYSGPTDAEKKAGDQQKKQIAEDNKNTPTSQSSTANVKIIDANQYDNVVEVRAFVSNIVESGGTCTVIFTSGNSVITKISEASQDATTTQCKTVDVDRGEFSRSGTWNVAVDYASARSRGRATTTVEVK